MRVRVRVRVKVRVEGEGEGEGDLAHDPARRLTRVISAVAQAAAGVAAADAARARGGAPGLEAGQADRQLAHGVPDDWQAAHRVEDVALAQEVDRGDEALQVRPQASED